VFARQIASTNGEAPTSVGVSFIESTVMNDQTRLMLVGIVTAARLSHLSTIGAE
jgi:hypothetical protein